MGRLEGFSIPEIEVGCFQDLLSWSGDFKYLALIKWNINSENEPGFNICVADTDIEKVVFFSDRIEGICKDIKLVKSEVKYITIRNGDEIKQAKNIFF